MLTLEWTSADSEVLTLLNRNSDTCHFSEMVGLGSPEADIVNQRAPYQHGQTSLRAILQPRSIKFKLRISGTSFADLETNKATVGRIFSPLSAGNLPNIGTLQITVDGGTVYKITCTAQGADLPAGKGARGPLFQYANVYLLADDPFFYVLPAVSVALAQGVAASCNNLGDVWAEPIITVNGPANSPIITNQATGQLIKFNANVPNGQQLIIDHRFGKKSALLGATNWMPYLDVSSSFWSLAKGASNVLFSDSNAGGSASIQWTRRYLAI